MTTKVLGVTPGGRHIWLKSRHGIIRKPIEKANEEELKPQPVLMGKKSLLKRLIS